MHASQRRHSGLQRGGVRPRVVDAEVGPGRPFDESAHALHVGPQLPLAHDLGQGQPAPVAHDAVGLSALAVVHAIRLDELGRQRHAHQLLAVGDQIAHVTKINPNLGAALSVVAMQRDIRMIDEEIKPVAPTLSLTEMPIEPALRMN